MGKIKCHQTHQQITQIALCMGIGMLRVSVWLHWKGPQLLILFFLSVDFRKFKNFSNYCVFLCQIKSKSNTCTQKGRSYGKLASIIFVADEIPSFPLFPILKFAFKPCLFGIKFGFLQILRLEWQTEEEKFNFYFPTLIEFILHNIFAFFLLQHLRALPPDLGIFLNFSFKRNLIFVFFSINLSNYQSVWCLNSKRLISSMKIIINRISNSKIFI